MTRATSEQAAVPAHDTRFRVAIPVGEARDEYGKPNLHPE
jgi:hypothetical protein